jgi:hypothetical protein
MGSLVIAPENLAGHIDEIEQLLAQAASLVDQLIYSVSDPGDPSLTPERLQLVVTAAVNTREQVGFVDEYAKRVQERALATWHWRRDAERSSRG